MKRISLVQTALIALTVVPGFAQELLDPPLKDWPVARYWLPTMSSTDRMRELGLGRNLAARPSGEPEMSASTATALSPAVGAITGALSFIAVTPCRLVDTRSGQGFSGAFGPPALAALTPRDIPVPSGSCGIPSSALGYSLNVGILPTAPVSFVSLFPTGQSFPGVATLGSPTGSSVSDAAIVPAGTSGSIRVLSSNATELIIDINGYFATQTGAKTLGGFVRSDIGATSLPLGVLVTHTATGRYILSFPAGTFTQTIPTPTATPENGSAVSLLLFSSAVNGDGSGTIELDWIVSGSGNPGTAADTSFSFVITQN